MANVIMEKDATPFNPRTVKAARLLSLASVVGWMSFYVIVVISLFYGEEGHLAHPLVHPIGLAYIASGVLGSWLMKRKGLEVAGGIVVFLGYLGTTCAMVILAFPLFIPDPTGFPWYVYPMLAILALGIFGGSLVIR